MPWLDEGLSHVAEEELYYASALHGSGENLTYANISASGAQTTAFNAFAAPNLTRFRDYLVRPDMAGLEHAVGNANRGMTWAFLRYAADRHGGLESSFWSALAFSRDTGMTNIKNRIGSVVNPWIRDFLVSVYTADAVGGIAAIYTQPSWNFRSIYGGVSLRGDPLGYPLHVTAMVCGVGVSSTLGTSGGTRFMRFGVPGSGFGSASGTTTGANQALVLVRTK
ncbi:MAG: Peptidase hyicolysin [Gemmatimonadetes bacterium]|nr:Peptidase hyicolysin [Gemmatimonadota bacterium]